MDNLFSKNLKKAIKVKGLKQKAIASSAGIAPAYLSEILGDKKVPSDRVIHLLCKAVGISERWALTGEGGMDLEDKEEKQYPDLDKYPELALVIREILPKYAGLNLEERLELSRDIARKAREIIIRKEEEEKK